MGIGAGVLRHGDHLREVEVPAEVGAPEVQGAEVGEVEAQGSAASPRARLHIHQLGNLPKETEAIQGRGTGREQAAQQNHRRARRLFLAVFLLRRLLLSIRSLHIPVHSSSTVVLGHTQINMPLEC